MRLGGIMPELNQGPISGVPVSLDATSTAIETTPTATPETDSGQAAKQEGRTSGQAQEGTPGTQGTDDSFFDFNAIADNPELVKAYKQMQGKFTQKMQELGGHRQKIEAYDAFMTDPIGQLQAMARQYGMVMTRAEAAAQLQQQQQQQQGPQGNAEWEPKSWDEVLGRAKELAKQEIMQELSPVIHGVQKIQAGNIEAQLDKLDPQWRMYEDEMRQNLNAHPSLVKDVAKLYRLSVPDEVFTSRATQEALKKLQSKTNAAHVGEKGHTSKTTPATRKVNSFQDAVSEAKRLIAEGGGR